jgi:glutamine amidotransferase
VEGYRTLTAIVLDMGCGNIQSLCSALRYIGINYEVTATPLVEECKEWIILPGVGSFGRASEVLQRSGLANFISHHISTGSTKILGICVGYQLLFESSDESPGAMGLGLLQGSVHSLSSIPSVTRRTHTGWNDVKSCEIEYFKKNIESYFFNHSYYVKNDDETAAKAYVEYCGFEFPVAIEKSNIFGVQFHPEKSDEAGLAYLKAVLSAR